MVMAELGSSADVKMGSGLSREGARLYRMTRREWYDVVREMTEQDSTVGAILFAVEMTLRRTNFRIEAVAESEEAKRWATFIEEAIDDLDQPFPSKLSEIISFVAFGYALFEVVYKVRGGMDTSDRSRQSPYDDGLIGWRKWAYRPPETITGWVRDDSGEIVAARQVMPDYKTVEIPLDRCLLFQSGSRYSDPEGVSILRRAYHPWRGKREIEIAEAIGVYRDLAGLLVMDVPENVVTGTTPKDQQAKRATEAVMRNVRRGTQEGLMVPSSRDASGNRLYDAKLLSSGGRRQFDTSQIIERYKTDIAMTILADYILMGHQNVGTYSTSQSKVALFNKAMNAWLDVICSTINEQAIGPLLRVNGVGREFWPIMEHDDPDAADIESLATALSSLANAGILDVNDEVRAAVHEMLGIPRPTIEDEPEDTSPDNVTTTPFDPQEEEVEGVTVVPVALPGAAPAAVAPSGGAASA